MVFYWRKLNKETKTSKLWKTEGKGNADSKNNSISENHFKNIIDHVPYLFEPYVWYIKPSLTHLLGSRPESTYCEKLGATIFDIFKTLDFGLSVLVNITWIKKVFACGALAVKGFSILKPVKPRTLIVKVVNWCAGCIVLFLFFRFLRKTSENRK